MPIFVERELTRDFRQPTSNVAPSPEHDARRSADLRRNEEPLDGASKQAPLPPPFERGVAEASMRVVLAYPPQDSTTAAPRTPHSDPTLGLTGSSPAMDSPMKRETQLHREAERLARIHANQSFDADPSRSPDNTRVEAELRKLAGRYRDVVTGETPARLERELLVRYQDTYESLHSQRFDNELNWIQRRYYGAREWLASTWHSLPSIKSLYNDAIDLAHSAGSFHGLYAAAIKAPAILINGALATGTALLQDTFLMGRGDRCAEAPKEALKRPLVNSSTATAKRLAESPLAVAGGSGISHLETDRPPTAPPHPSREAIPTGSILGRRAPDTMPLRPARAA